jgi:eukaryotic-like serine/threonine-protein kinase
MSAPVPAIAELLADQRRRWAQNDRVAVEAYLWQHPALRNHTEALLDLIYQEVYLRTRQGNAAKPELDEYLRRFPRLAGPIREQFEVHEAIESAPAEPGLPTIPGYEVSSEIGRGGMGRVYKAKNSQGSWVAVKVLRAEHFANRTIRKRFVAESRTVSALEHPHSGKVLDVNESDGEPYFVMELIEGRSLEEVIQSGSVPCGQAAEWLISVAEAIHYAHGKGIIHRDLKPANVMLDAAGRPRVMDFGMAKILREAGIAGPSSTKQGMILGTPGYMPPEQAGAGNIEPGPYSDVYSLGAILYALLAGRPPFDEGDFVGTLLKVRSTEQATPVRQLRADVPPVLESICQRCLDKRPADRFRTALELAEALRQATQALAPLCLSCVLTGELIPIVKELTIIGRAPECDLVLKAPDVSRRHCRIVCESDQVMVEDLGSSHGTRVNGVAVTRSRLNGGDRLEIAKQVFKVLLRRNVVKLPFS